MSKKRRQYSSDFKAKVALAALKGDEITSELAARFELHPSMVNQWKPELLDNAAGLFKGSSGMACSAYRLGHENVLEGWCQVPYRRSSFNGTMTSIGLFPQKVMQGLSSRLAQAQVRLLSHALDSPT